MTDAFVEWIYDHAGGLIVTALIVAFAALIFFLASQDSDACDRLMAFSRTHSDSMQVMLKCDGPSEMPVVVPVYSR